MVFLLSVVSVELLVDRSYSSTYSKTIILQKSMILWTKGKQPFTRGWTRWGRGRGIRWAELGVEGRNQGWRGRGVGVEGAGIEGAGSLVWLGREIDFFNRKFRENGSFRHVSYIKVHQGKHASLCGPFCHRTHVMDGASRISAWFFLLSFKEQSLPRKRDYQGRLSLSEW